MNSTSGKNKVCAVIPFYNEEKTIKEIIEKTLDFADIIICIDDGSDDNSYNLVPLSERIIVLKNDFNMGKGYSLKRGLKKSIELNSDFTLTLDADFQHQPELIPLFIEKLNTFDIVIGNRMEDIRNMPLQRILSNKITSKLLSIKTKTKILDSQCGFRGFRTSILNLILPTFDGYEAESEMIIKAAKHKLKIGFVSIPAIYGNEESKMRPVQAIKGFIKVMFLKS